MGQLLAQGECPAVYVIMHRRVGCPWLTCYLCDCDCATASWDGNGVTATSRSDDCNVHRSIGRVVTNYATVLDSVLLRRVVCIPELPSCLVPEDDYRNPQVTIAVEEL
jgi:hypothetical protein